MPVDTTAPGILPDGGTTTAVRPGRRPGGFGRSRPGPRRRESLAGWLFMSPAVLAIGLFLLVPMLMAAWVSVSDWTGNGSPLSAGVHFVGLKHYAELITRPGLTRSDFAISLRNNFYFVVFVVPMQTTLALFLAVVLNQRRLKARGFFRTAYYFPTVTSSVAISVVFLFMFSSSGVVNGMLKLVGVTGPSWFADPRGIFQLLMPRPPAALTGHHFLGLSLYDWLSGPSVAMCSIIFLVVWTSTGVYTLMFLAALQNIPVSVDEAARIDGAGTWQRFSRVTFPQLRPTLFVVLTLGVIGTWQVFDQVYILSQGAPGNTTLTPAYLSYSTSFVSQEWGQGSAIAFLLFLLIVVLTVIQRLVMRERKA